MPRHEMGGFMAPNDNEAEDREQDYSVEISVIAPNGFGFGEGKIAQKLN